MNIEEGLRTPSKGTKPASTSSPSTNTRVNSPLNRNSSNSNQCSDNDQQQNQLVDELSKDASSSSMKVPDSSVSDLKRKVQNVKNKQEYVFIIPSSDDDTNVSTKGSTISRRRKAPSVNSGNSKSSDGLILTSNTNNELGLGPKRRNYAKKQVIEKYESSSNQEAPTTPTRSSGRDSKSRDSIPEKRLRLDNSNLVQNLCNQNSGQKVINRIQPTHLGSRTKMIDFQSVPSDLNMPRDQAMKLIEKLFLVKMPEDFFLFWEFAKTINHRKPCSAFSHSYLEWNLVGPYDVLSGLITDFHGFSKENLLRHCRYYYDPPEFQTVIMKKDKHFTHYGYYRDEPKEIKPIVVLNRAAHGGVIQEVGDNLFTLLRSELDTIIGSLTKSSQEIPATTFSSSSSRTPRSGGGGKSSNESTSSSTKQSQLEKAKAKQELTIIRDKLIDFCSTHENLSSESWSRTSTRQAKVTGKTLSKIDILAPIDVGEGDRKGLGVSEARMQVLLAKLKEIDELEDKANRVSIQTRETEQFIPNSRTIISESASSGAGLQMGLDLFFNGDPSYHNDIELLLTNAYKRLDRIEFVDVLKAHLAERKQGGQVSLLD